MEDMRKKTMPVRGHFITAGYQVDENSVKEMLTFMGAPCDDATVQEGIGYMSKNGMEVNMNNLYEFLKTKQVMCSRTDLRVKKN